MTARKKYATPEMEITLIDANILTGLGISDVGGGGQPGFGDAEDQLYLEE